MGRRRGDAAACEVVSGLWGDGGRAGGYVTHVELHDVFEVPPHLSAPVGLSATLWHIQTRLAVLLFRKSIVTGCGGRLIVYVYGSERIAEQEHSHAEGIHMARQVDGGQRCALLEGHVFYQADDGGDIVDGVVLPPCVHAPEAARGVVGVMSEVIISEHSRSNFFYYLVIRMSY